MLRIEKTHNKAKRQKMLAAIFITMAAAGISFGYFSMLGYAALPMQGTINDGPVRLRETPVNGAQVTLLAKGDNVTILAEETGDDGNIWYQIEKGGDGQKVTGYVRSDFVTTAEQSAELQNYKASLIAAGFPESYCDSLCALHQKYPGWKFVPIITGIDWNEAVAAESRAGKNLVQSAVNDARKSTDAAAYNWYQNKWYGYDGTGWVCASQEYIAYCMDPRNFLDETYIFQFETLDYAEYQEKSGVQNILAHTFMAGNYTDTDGIERNYAETFMEIGSSLGVSPYHLAARCKQEQGQRGSSPLISGNYQQYEGYYNYFNVRAFTTTSASSILNGLSYAKEQGWDSIYKSIAGGSQIVADKYIKKGQNTAYFEKFNVVYKKSLYSHQYMTNVMAAINEASSMAAAYTDKEQAFVFYIPVYSNMPTERATFSDKGNKNNWLSKLTVEGYELTPGFDGAKTEYAIIVGSDVASVKIAAQPVAGKSTVTGTGEYSLDSENNVLQVICTSQSGEPRTYTLSIVKQQNSTEENPDQAQQPSKEAIPTPEETQNSQAVQNTIVYGDINADGKISNADLVRLQKQILSIEQLDETAYQAADVSRDGKVTNKDLVILQKHILGIEIISGI